MKKKSNISNNALKILGFLLNKNAIAGGDIKVRQIFDSIGLTKEDFDSADMYLLQKKYVEGTIGGMDGSRWLTSSGIDFYEETDASDEPENLRGNEMPDPKKVFVVHGRDSRLRNDFFSFLRSLGLQPIEWSEALKLTQKATPYIGEALDSAFKSAQAVIVLLSPDDEVRLLPELWDSNESEIEKTISFQARPNVLFEAGMAFGTHQDRTLLVEVGQVKAFSDVAGRHIVRLSNAPDKRNDIAERLRTAGCEISTIGNDWLSTGNFVLTREKKNSTVGYSPSDLTDGDIIALLDSWWPKSEESFPDNVTVNFAEVDKQLSLPSGSTKKHITKIAKSKDFKILSSGNVFATFEYDVTSDHFGMSFSPR